MASKKKIIIIFKKGGAKAQDAGYVYEELIDKYGSSASLLNGSAVAKMHQGQFEDAETSLQEALTKVCCFCYYLNCF